MMTSKDSGEWPKAAMAARAKARGERQGEPSEEEPAEAAEKPSLAAGPTGRVYINSSQYFDGVLPVVWEFRIGGYQVCVAFGASRFFHLVHDAFELFADALIVLGLYPAALFHDHVRIHHN